MAAQDARYSSGSPDEEKKEKTERTARYGGAGCTLAVGKYPFEAAVGAVVGEGGGAASPLLLLLHRRWHQ
eukprot:952248-Rhodomonas_salina.2